MSLLITASILISISLSVMAQIFLKYGMSSAVVQAEIASFTLKSPFIVVTNIQVFLGLSCYVASAVTWLYVLSKVDVSKAYPFVGLGFIGTMIFAAVILHEPLTMMKVIGTLLVVGGIFLISMS